MLKERDIQAAIINYLSLFDHVRVFRINVGAVKFQDRFVRFGPKGMSDLIGIVQPSGRFLAIEVKTPTGKQTDHQAAFQRTITEMGGIYVLARSIDDVTFLQNEQ